MYVVHCEVGFCYFVTRAHLPSDRHIRVGPATLTSTEKHYADDINATNTIAKRSNQITGHPLLLHHIVLQLGSLVTVSSQGGSHFH